MQANIEPNKQDYDEKMKKEYSKLDNIVAVV